MKKITYLILLLLAFNLGYGQIVSWEMNGNSGSESTFNATTIDANLNTSMLSRGGGVNASSLANSFSSNNFTNSGTQTDAYTNNDYLEFQIAASVGYEVSLTTLDANFRRSGTGPNSFIWRYSTDGVNFTDIGSAISYTSTATGGTAQTQIDLTGITALQNVGFGTTLTFRLYGWGATGSTGTFAIGRLFGDDLSLTGSVSILNSCSSISTWDGTSWSPTVPDLTTVAIIDGPYTTNGTYGSFSACSLIVNSGNTLTIDNGYYVEVENDVIVDGGTIAVETQGAFVQNGIGGAEGTFSLINSGTTNLNKSTRNYTDDGLHYTYWSSPVVNADIVTVFPTPDGNRRYSFDGSAFLDQHTVGTTNGIPDDIDDDNNDWVVASGAMTPGYGYAVTASAPFPFPGPINYSDNANFTGAFNNGDISVTVYRNNDEINDKNWNLLGNPYPSAISTDDFFAENGYNISTNPTGAIESVIYLWTHNSVASQANPGNEGYNFSQDDYAMINYSGANSGAPGGGGIPNDFIPSGQGFFVEMSDNVTPTGGSNSIFSATVVFNNNMRRADGTSNSQFFKNSGQKKRSKIVNKQRYWINLTSDNGVFNQILIAYVDGATNQDDGLSYDARRINNGNASILYSIIEGSDKKFAIQGKNPNSLDENESIQLGFKTNIEVATLYKISLANVQGEFLTNHPIYLKDNLLNKVHDLSVCDYAFTSEVGEFNDRFVIAYSSSALLSTDEALLGEKSLRIVELEDDNVQFKVSNNLKIKTVEIYDLLGRALYHFKTNAPSKTFNLSKLNSSVFIAKVELSNGAIISRKAVKK